MAALTNRTDYKGYLTPRSALVAAIAVLVVVAAIRGFAYLAPGAPPWMAPAGFVLMAATPWLFFTREGRRSLGLTRARSRTDYVYAAVAGGLAASVCFGLGIALYGETGENWFVTVAATYQARDPGGLSLVILHLIFTVPAVTFSPIGEELFFRGTLQRAFETRTSIRTAMVLQAVAFGVVHLFHHGLTRGPDGVGFLAVPGLIWVALMFGTALVFAGIRQRSGSLYAAIVSHAAFNLVMNLFIFSFLWN